nr:MAG TPA: hypothetical protein [Caudoviricetes sp.]
MSFDFFFKKCYKVTLRNVASLETSMVTGFSRIYY